MIAYTYIHNNIRSLNNRYVRSKTTKEADFLSKLAILELCGWLEVSVDDMIECAGRRLLKDQSHQKFLKNRVKTTYGFEYDKNFRSLMAFVVGLYGLEIIEKSIDPVTCIKFKNELAALKIRRDSLAHTYTKGATANYDAPSVTLARLNDVSAGLKAYDDAIRAFKLR